MPYDDQPPEHWCAVLDKCRQRLSEVRSKPAKLGRLLLRRRWVIRPSAQIIYRDQRTVLEHGRVHWGCNLQSHDATFQSGHAPLPGSFVHSTSARYDGRPSELFELRSKLFRSMWRLSMPDQLKHQLGSEDELFVPPRDMPVVTALRRLDRLTLAHGVPIPAEPNLYGTLTMIHREHFPYQRLTSGLFPVIFAPERSPLAIPLPSSLWPQHFIDASWRK